ncbi:hypothetical protein P692DRAFT_20752124, partial [Suillus brevipes Sb2]
LKNMNQEHVASYNEAHQAMCKLKGVMEDVRKWGVIIYDEGTCISPGLHWSKGQCADVQVI